MQVHGRLECVGIPVQAPSSVRRADTRGQRQCRENNKDLHSSTRLSSCTNGGYPGEQHSSETLCPVSSSVRNSVAF